jgi:peptidyl-prolyl cis-trans isomerase A (cyclophilin A)
MQRNHIVTIFVLTIVILATPTVSAEEQENEFVPPSNLEEGWYARIETSVGRIVAKLLPEQAPQSVAYFASAAEGRLEWFDRAGGELKKGHYYDGIKIHKALAGRRFEAGDPAGTGFSPPDLFVPLEGLGPVNFNSPGRLGMTRDGAAVSALMFFVTSSAQPWLTGNHPCFGIVISGQWVVTNLSQVKTYNNGRPIDPPIIERIRIFTVGDPAPLEEPKPYFPKRHRFEPRPNMQQTEPRVPD